MDVVAICKDILMKYESVIFAYIFGSYATGCMKVVISRILSSTGVLL